MLVAVTVAVAVGMGRVAMLGIWVSLMVVVAVVGEMMVLD